ncbi:hypothetical protein IAQ61_003649 [Plenodomus lingam]|uniref:uncharacterized protein n=1 Tax=Leptosphaeria maculans TaxID=5022 RepID=UPI003322191F|nr:hypothetical protein IAQ61_003649 [Plenodomus lingam]
MTEGKSNGDPQELVVLVVPVQHVKTVKTALEQSGHLDRSSKITAETQEIEHIEAARPASSKMNALASLSSYGPAGGSDSSPTAPSGPTGTTQFPALQFDPISGEYRDPAEWQSLASSLHFDVVTGQYRKPADQPQFPSLRFCPESGQYRKPAESNQFPRLDFDLVAGEYRDPAEIQQYPALEFDVRNGQYEDRSEEPRLQFVPTSGEYRPPCKHRGSNRGNSVQQQRMRIPTTIPYEFNKDDEHGSGLKATVLNRLGLCELSPVMSLSSSTLHDNIMPRPTNKNPLQNALQAALEENHDSLLAPLDLTAKSLMSNFPDSYSIYTPMLLLSHNAFASAPWQTLLSAHPLDSDALKPLWNHITRATHTTHMALNSPIPAQTPSTTTTDQPNNNDNNKTHPNILRSPLNITPIFGSFGPPPTPQSLTSPTLEDYASAFWVRTTQNGIHQTWAPLYTMFSRGNVKEKARILHFPGPDTTSITTNNHHGDRDSHTASPPPPPTIAADLFAGIGYFAFSYRKRATHPPTKVLAWELNPWSIEALRRGAALNNWSTRIITPASLASFLAEQSQIQDQGQDQDQDIPTIHHDFTIFHMSNENAATTVAQLRRQRRLPGAIVHVNLGLLPDSKAAWTQAVRVLEPECAEGWIHVHENVGVGDVGARRGEVEREFARLVAEEGRGSGGRGRRVEVRHVERIKMYAPGVVHCVFDVCVFLQDRGSGLD